MWTVFVFRGVTMLRDREGRIVTYAVGARGDRLRGMAVRLNRRRVQAMTV